MQKFAPLRHENHETKSDEELAAEAKTFFTGSVSLQFLAALWHKLREDKCAWWTTDGEFEAFPPQVILPLFADRIDLRQRATTELTGLIAKTARKKTPEFQADLIQSAIDEQDVTPERYLKAFSIEDILCYGGGRAFNVQFTDKMPWIAREPHTRKLVATILQWLLDRDILSHLQIRSAIEEKVWQEHMSLELRTKFSRARIEAEVRGELFGSARDEIEMITLDAIAMHIPLQSLYRVYAEGVRIMGFATDIPTPLIPPSLQNTTPTKLRPPPESVEGVRQAIDGEKSDTEVEIGEVDASEVSLEDGSPSSEASGSEPVPKSLREKYPNAPVLDMGSLACEAIPPPKQGSGSGKHSGLHDLTEKIKLEPELEKLGIKVLNPTDYPTDDLRELLQVLTDKKWPESIQRVRAICESFLRDRNPEQTLETMGHQALLQAFNDALVQCNEEKLFPIAAALMPTPSSKQAPPPLPTTETQKTG